MAHADFSGAWLVPQFVATCVLKPGWDMLEAPRLPHHETFVSFEHEYLLAYMQLADAKAAVFMAITSGAIAYIVGHYGLGWSAPDIAASFHQSRDLRGWLCVLGHRAPHRRRRWHNSFTGGCKTNFGEAICE